MTSRTTEHVFAILKKVTYESVNTLALSAKSINSARYWPNNGQAIPSHFYTEQPLFAFHM